MKRFTQLIVTFTFAFLAAFSVPAISEIGIVQDTLVSANSLFDGKEVSTNTTNSEAGKITTAIFSAANIFAGFVLAISVIMIIVGGLRYILANGEPRQAEQGKMILIYSGIGIVIALSAFVIARLFTSFNFAG